MGGFATASSECGHSTRPNQASDSPADSSISNAAAAAKKEVISISLGFHHQLLGQHVIDRLEVVGAGGMEIAAARHVGDFLERLFVQLGAHGEAAKADNIAPGGAEAHGIDPARHIREAMRAASMGS